MNLVHGAILLFIVMVLLPFVYAWSEIVGRRDVEPLPINMHYVKDPNYFALNFRDILKQAIGPIGKAAEMRQIFLSKKEYVEISGSRHVDAGQRVDCLLYVQGDLRLAERVVLLKEAYAGHGADIGPDSHLRALYAEADVAIGHGARIVRWLFAAGAIQVQPDCDLGRNVSCHGTLAIAPAAHFRSLYGVPIAVGGPPRAGTGETPDPGAESLFPAEPTEGLGWNMLHDGLTVNEPNAGGPAAPQPDKARHAREVQVRDWLVYRNRVDIPAGSRVNRNFVTRKRLLIHNGCQISGDIHGYGDIVLGRNVSIHGNVFAEGNILVGHDCRIHGHVFSQQHVRLGRGTQVSEAGAVKSVIGKKGVRLEPGVCIYGYVMTDGRGVIA